MKEVEDITFQEKQTMEKLLKLNDKIAKTTLLQRRLLAMFWEDFSKNHGYGSYQIDLRTGTVYEGQVGGDR